jgi:hypothetical protein
MPPLFFFTKWFGKYISALAIGRLVQDRHVVLSEDLREPGTLHTMRTRHVLHAMVLPTLDNFNRSIVVLH